MAWRKVDNIKGYSTLYGVKWAHNTHPLEREFLCIRNGGQWITENGSQAGMGMLFHYKAAIKIIWPEIKFHKWNELIMEQYFLHRTIGIIGAASTGKTNTAALLALMDYYTFPHNTTVMCCSTTKERLEDRIFGEIKNLHRRAKQRFPHLPGHLIEGRMRIITDDRKASDEARDFRNGIVGIPCKKGETYVGLGDFAGIKNTRVRVFGDELSLLPRVFVDAVSNMDKNDDLKAMGLGNPKDTTDALGIFCEPADSEGGWESGIDQEPGTKIWKTRRPDGIAIQLPGTDSPNLDGKLGIPLITQKQINRDIAFYGRDSVWFTMMNEGRMPRGQGVKRVLTRQMCYKFKAIEEPLWKDSGRTRIGFLDAAYGGVGGDRCVFGELQFGQELPPTEDPIATAIASQKHVLQEGKRIMALIDMKIVPIKNDPKDSPEDQISRYCKAECEARGIPPDSFFYDSGMRTSLVSSMVRLWSPVTRPIDSGGTGTERKVSVDIPVSCKDYYSNFITEMWYSVRHIVESGQFRGMTEEVMLEGCTRMWEIVGANKIKLEPKADMKLRVGRSPDLFDALAIGVEGARQKGFQIMRLGSPKFLAENNRWKKELRDRSLKLFNSGVLDHAA
jgi:hypothetical protein